MPIRESMLGLIVDANPRAVVGHYSYAEAVGCVSRALVKSSELETQPNEYWISKRDAS